LVNSGNRSKRVYTEFVNALLELASTFLTLALIGYSRNPTEPGNKAVVNASRALNDAERFMAYLSVVCPAETAVLQDKLTALRERRDGVRGLRSLAAIGGAVKDAAEDGVHLMKLAIKVEGAR
jgi:hypothetical protein